MMEMAKKRLDVLLAERGLAESWERAQRLILAGEVRVGGRVAAKPGERVDEAAELSLRAKPRYVSRGGEKLAAALDAFGVEVAGRVALDVGASTGGFTHCLLERQVARVYAVDVGYGQLAWRLREDPRVVALERTNIRYLEELPEAVALAVVDVSFISLRLVLPALRGLLAPEGEVVALIKPQFEAGRERVGKGGVVKDPEVHREVLEGMAHWAQKEGFAVRGLVPSPLKGPAGNIEFFIHLGLDVRGEGINLSEAVARCLNRAQTI